jgi:hypothetical protein
VERILVQRTECLRRGKVVSKTTNWHGLAIHIIAPLSEESDEHVGSEAPVKELREEVQVGNQCRLENNRDVRGIEKLHRVAALVSTLLLTLQWQINTKSLEEDDDEEDQYGSEQVCKIRC